MKFSIQLKIFLGFALSILLLISMGVLAYQGKKTIVSAIDHLRHDAELVAEVNNLVMNLRSAESAQRGYLLTSRSYYLDPFNDAISEVKPSMDRIDLLLADGAEASLDTVKLRDLAGQKVGHMREALAAHAQEGPDSALQVLLSDKGYNSMREISQMSSNLLQKIQTTGPRRQQEVAGIIARTELITVIATILAVMLSFIIAFVIARGIAKPLSDLTVAARRISMGDTSAEIPDTHSSDEVGSLADAFRKMVAYLQRMAKSSESVARGDLTNNVKIEGDSDQFGRAQAEMVTRLSALVKQVRMAGEQVNLSAMQIAATAKQQQITTSQVESTSLQISATAKDVSGTSRELLQSADKINNVAEETAELATEGKIGLTRMESDMQRIIDASQAITSNLGVMTEKAANINLVVTTIAKVADQTNLLSLNAAIEAEKAGEYGKGFSVVAGEIRRLSDQTSASTADIEQMVREMVAAVSAGVAGMEKFAEEVRNGVRGIGDVSRQLDQVIKRVQSLPPSAEALHEGMRSQNHGAQQISDALQKLGEAAHQTADSIRASSHAVNQLNEATRGLQAGISQFKLPS